MELITLTDFLDIPRDKMRGKVICFPTDTVYGLGAMINDISAIRKIYQIKHREEKKPLAILINDFDNLSQYVAKISPQARNLMEKHWPGPLTLIFEKSHHINDEINQSGKTIAFRMPNCELTLQLINHLGFLATTSVNISGENELNDIDDIVNTFNNQIDYIITDPVSLSRLSSTVVDVTKDIPLLIRQGIIKI